MQTILNNLARVAVALGPAALMGAGTAFAATGLAVFFATAFGPLTCEAASVKAYSLANLELVAGALLVGVGRYVRGRRNGNR